MPSWSTPVRFLGPAQLRTRLGSLRSVALVAILGALLLSGLGAISTSGQTASLPPHSPVLPVHPSSGSPAPVASGNNSTRGWSEVGNFSSVGPSIRDMSMMAYDPTIHKVVLFGGYDPSVVPLGDTWTYGNGTWTQLSFGSNATPAPRWHAGMVWDAADEVIVLFGGRNVSQFFNDTWTFNGTAWTHVATTSAPSPRGLVGMTYDAADGYVLLYGGGEGNAPAGSGQPWQFFGDTWSYRAGTWTQITTGATTPGALADFSMAYDPTQQLVYAFGGSTNASGCSPSGGLWSYAAGSWKSVTPTGGAAPSARYAETMAYYPTDSALLLFGGVDGGSCAGTATDTWELKNSSWTNLSSGLSASPNARDEATMAYDSADSRMVLFGGNLQGSWYDYYNDTWVFPGISGGSGSGGGNGTGGNHTGGGNGSGGNRTGNSSGSSSTCTVHGWCLLSTPVAPAERDQATMAFDPAIGAVVLFGGYSQYVYPLGDTWTYTNGTWTDISSVMLNSPAARWSDGLVWDAADHYMLLFGGRNLTQFFNDTWQFNGSSWSQVTTTNAPSPRNHFAMVYDAQTSSVILFGGWRGNLAGTPAETFSDTWSYHAGVWTNLTGATSPPPMADDAYAWDNHSSTFYLFGQVGDNSGCPGVGVLWSYANGSWTNLTGSASTPPAGVNAGSMAYYPGVGGELYFGGSQGGGCYAASSGATFQLASGTWTNLTANLTSAPTPRYESAMAYDPIDGQVVLFGGAQQGSWSLYYNETWVFPANRTHGNNTGGGSGNGSGGGNDSPFARASQTVDRGRAPLWVLFSAVATVTAGQATYRWDFGDGSTLTGGALVDHTFTVPGTYTPTVRVTDTLGHSLVLTLTPVHVLGASIAPSRPPAPMGPSGLADASSPFGLLSGAAVGVAAVLAAAVAFEERRTRRRQEAAELLRELETGRVSAMDP